MSQHTLTSSEYRKAAGLEPPGADRSKTARPELTETDLHLAVVEWLRSLEWEDPAPLWTHPANEESDKIKRIRDWRMGQEPGWPDFVFLLPQGGTLLIELKTPRGRQSKEQTEFEDRASDLGHIYDVARSVSDVHDALRRAGVNFSEPRMARAMRGSR